MAQEPKSADATYDEYVSTEKEVLRYLREAQNVRLEDFEKGPLGPATLQKLLQSFFKGELWFLWNFKDRTLATARKCFAIDEFYTQDGWQLFATSKTYKDGRRYQLDTSRVMTETIEGDELPRFAALRGLCEEADLLIDADWVHVLREGGPPEKPELSGAFPGMLSYRFYVHGSVVLPERPADGSPIVFRDDTDVVHTEWRRRWVISIDQAEILSLEHYLAIGPKL